MEKNIEGMCRGLYLGTTRTRNENLIRELLNIGQTATLCLETLSYELKRQELETNDPPRLYAD